ncbi:hypothetical protein [Paenibacillus sp. 32O-W]|uniref:hypothetical protein n=1 Tax=Paenibacillus sp. 32O-W TaxID=1695218 RepID=UPI0011A59325|nr:hypothetical protein [Paenibacillus sp. 32O-W]
MKIVGVLLALALAIGIPTVSVINSDENADFSNSIPTTNGNVPDYSENEQGDKIGHGPFAPGPSQEPDLIRAEGGDGVVGYVKASDMNPSFSSPEEAIANQEAIEEIGYRSIPLYDSDGKTVIGEFKMYPSNRQ